MWHPNRGTPLSGEAITKLVRQNYKPKSPEPYVHEVVQCRTDKTCQEHKPDSYWNNNFYRRQENLQRGFYTSLTEPYRPIGGEMILDSYDLVQTALPDVLEKRPPRLHYRRGTIINDLDTLKSDQSSERDLSLTSGDLQDMCPSAGYNSIRRLLRESKNRMISVRAGMAYEDHVKAVEEQQLQEMLSQRPADNEMAIQSMSALCMPLPSSDSLVLSQHGSTRSGPAVSDSVYDRTDRMQAVCDSLMLSSPPPMYKREGRRQSILHSPTTLSAMGSKPHRVSLMGISSGISQALQKKERLFKDHVLYLQSIYSMLTALHNMKVRDIRSKVPLSKEVIEKYQRECPHHREDERLTGASRGPNTTLPRISSVKPPRRESLQVEAEADNPVSKFSVFGVAKRLNLMDAANKHVFGRRKSRGASNLAENRGPVVETWEDLLNVQRQEYKEPEEPVSFNFGIVAKFMRWVRKSRNEGKPEVFDGRHVNTWDDLLNVQPQEYKEPDGLRFQVGLVAKFIRWYRIASVLPTPGGGTPDPQQIAQLQELNQRSTQQADNKHEKEEPPAQTSHAEKVKKLPIWQQVAQERSTVFHTEPEEKAPKPDAAVERLKKNMYKLKKSLEKENNAEIEKLTRERVANFRLKYGTLNHEECSCLFEEQKHRIQDVKDHVNKSTLENFDIQPSKWYEELWESTESLGFPHSHPLIADVTANLQTFAHMDNKTVSYAKAKLCLLMMSLPAYDICQIYVQQALKFIFENILLGQESQFTDWLHHRKIPYVLLTDMASTRSSLSNN